MQPNVGGQCCPLTSAVHVNTSVSPEPHIYVIMTLVKFRDCWIYDLVGPNVLYNEFQTPERLKDHKSRGILGRLVTLEKTAMCTEAVALTDLLSVM